MCSMYQIPAPQIYVVGFDPSSGTHCVVALHTCKEGGTHQDLHICAGDVDKGTGFSLNEAFDEADRRDKSCSDH